MTINFAKRNIKELLRDPMSIIFGILLPLFLLIIFKQFNIPSDVYKLENFTPGIIVFSYSFITLFTAQLVSKDKSTSFLSRLFVSPMKPINFILGYTLSLIPIIIIQNIAFFTVAILLGLKFSISIIYTILVLIIVSLLFIGLGILLGTISTEKSAPAVTSLIVQVVAFTSGMWFSIDAAGNIYKIVCKILPFNYTVDLTRNVLNKISNNILLDITIIIVYIIIIYLLGSILFKNKMTSDNK